jgi:formate dehydrogenase beta subunit
VELGPGGPVRVDPETLATTAAGIFAGGDVAFGPRNLIDAVADGKKAAAGIHRFFNGDEGEARFHFQFDKIPTRSYERSDAYDLLPRETPPTVDLGRRTGISEVESGYDESAARRQAERCLICHVQTVYDAEKCVLCNRCVDICPTGCLKLVPLEEIDLPPETLASACRLGGAGEGPASAMLKDDELCIRCGLCAIRCPTDAMTMEVLHYEQS